MLQLLKICCRIWDKITVGAYRILVFVAVVTLTTLRRLLLRGESVDNVLDTINNVRHSDNLQHFIIYKRICFFSNF